jgi:hypothetical protein
MKNFFTTIAMAMAVVVHAGNITFSQPNTPIVPLPLPPPGAASHADQIVEKFNTLGRTTIFNLVKTVQLEGDTGEPEGMVNINEERYIISLGMYTTPTVSYGNNTIINGTDRTPGAGVGHLVVFDGEGNRIADLATSNVGDIEYHMGGIDYDGENVWATLAQYRPNSTATILKIDPQTLQASTVLQYNDHEGGIVHDPLTKRIATLNWGSRNTSIFDLTNLEPAAGSEYTPAIKVTQNPSFYVDYQDCKFLGHPEFYDYRAVMICSGVTALTANCTIGGIAIVDVNTMIPLSEVPLTMTSELGVAITENPFDVDIVDGNLRLYFAPDQHNTTVYIYEPVLDSPREY